MACSICPRNCKIDRAAAAGFCGCSSVVRVARAALHFDEEPCISGTRGSGTIFFSGCNLKCIFCQNYVLTDGTHGEIFSVSRLAEMMLKLQDLGAHNVNLVTPTPHRDAIVDALKAAKQDGLTIPVVYNTGSYETVETVRAFEGLVDIFLPDLKYRDPRLSLRFSHASDYFDVAIEAIAEMFRQVGPMVTDGDGIAVKGVRIRHLVLPGCVFDTRSVLDAIRNRFGTDCPVSLMSQFTPIPECTVKPLDRPLTRREYDSALDYCISLGFTNVYSQELSSVGRIFTPPFSDHVNL
ncbi:MAG: radical SAM protein [Clostridia bacterium]|nr:radical SAM protein [Clostridia bacterium]